jgi:phospholipid/cholesterol/gamma-HCH transport system substrate-binding protein/paraquat-inducible protein B
MSTKPSYFKVGLFVIVAALLILAAIMVFGAGILTQQRIYFETYFDESISGLKVGSPVEFRGVRIGQVEEIAFVRDKYELQEQSSGVTKYGSYVMVLCSVPRENLPEISYEKRVSQIFQMVNEGLRLQLASNLLTGQAYLQGSFIDPNRYPLPEIIWEPEHIYIPSAPSTFTTLKDSVDNIMYQLQQIEVDKLVASVESTLKSLDNAINEARVGDVSKEARELLTLARTKIEKFDTEKLGRAAQDAFSSVDHAVTDANVPEVSRDLKNLIVEIRQTNKSLQQLFGGPEPVAAQGSLPEVINRLNTTLGRIDKLVSTERPQIEMIITNFKEISDDLKTLTNNLKRHPSELIFSEPPKKSEVTK